MIGHKLANEILAIMTYRRSNSPRQHGSRLALTASLPLLMLLACQGTETVPETGRTRPKLQYSEAEMNAMGAQAYEDILSKAKIITGTPEADMVKRVGAKLAETTGKDYDWRFNLIDDDEILNAFCLPGGKVAVYSGILAITEDDAGLSVVLSHEIAHATLQHGNERMSQPTYKQIIGIPVGLTTDLWGAIAPGSRKVVMDSFGLGFIVGSVMPYSQQDEIEADEVGLRYMQKAGYDLAAAPAFWKRMQAATADARPSDMLSSHPDSEKRAEDLNRVIKEMKAEQAGSKGQFPD